MSSLIDTLRSDAAIARPEASRLGRIATGFAAHLTWRRVAFTFALAALVSTQPLFQPHIYSGFLLEHFLGIWRDYFVECAVMASCLLLALTLAEAASDGAGRGTGLVALLAALFGGSLVGALLVLPWYGLGWDDAFRQLALGRRRRTGLRSGSAVRRPSPACSGARRPRRPRCTRRRSTGWRCRGRCWRRAFRSPVRRSSRISSSTRSPT